MKTFDKLEVVRENLGLHETLESLTRALSVHELESSLIFIARMWGTSVEELRSVVNGEMSYDFVLTETLLIDLAKSLSDDELNENLDYIARMWDINFKEEN